MMHDDAMAVTAMGCTSSKSSTAIPEQSALAASLLPSAHAQHRLQ
jgi:hypothetical protein